MSRKATIKVYHGFGHKHDMEVFGHVFEKYSPKSKKYTRNPFRNMLALFRLFFVRPIPDIPLQLSWQDEIVKSHTEYDGFFRFAWAARSETHAGLHEVEISGDGTNGAISPSIGYIFVPHITQYAFISDIDDTILISHSATKFRRLKELLFKNAKDRSVFPDVAAHYSLLANAHTTEDAPNPFFYVSSSEWNLYDYLKSIFRRNELPEGAFLLSQVKHWYELWKTGKTKHEGKLLRILRIFEIFPNQHFVLFGDNSQSDPAIYDKLAEKYSHRIFAVYIRNVRENATTAGYLRSMEQKGIHTCLFNESSEAILHSKKIGLI